MGVRLGVANHGGLSQDLVAEAYVREIKTPNPVRRTIAGRRGPLSQLCLEEASRGMH